MGLQVEEFCEVIDTEEALTAGTMLDSIPEYDSMAVLMLLNWLDSKGINVSPADFEKFKTVGDILNLAKA